jgi:hypothetical protein
VWKLSFPSKTPLIDWPEMLTRCTFPASAAERNSLKVSD